jgi:phage gp36-like protein
MPYTSLEILEKYYSPKELVAMTDSKGEGSINEEYLNEVIEDVSAEIDQKAAEGGYSIPFADPTPRIIQTLATDYAVYELKERGGASQSTLETLWDSIDTRLSKLEDGEYTFTSNESSSIGTLFIGTKSEDDIIFTKEKLSELKPK